EVVLRQNVENQDRRRLLSEVVPAKHSRTGIIDRSRRCVGAVIEHRRRRCCRTLFALNTLDTLDALRTLRTYRTLISGLTLRPLRPLRTRWSLRPGWTDRTRNADGLGEMRHQLRVLF